MTIGIALMVVGGLWRSSEATVYESATATIDEIEVKSPTGANFLLGWINRNNCEVRILYHYSYNNDVYESSNVYNTILNWPLSEPDAFAFAESWPDGESTVAHFGAKTPRHSYLKWQTPWASTATFITGLTLLSISYRGVEKHFFPRKNRNGSKPEA